MSAKKPSLTELQALAVEAELALQSLLALCVTLIEEGVRPESEQMSDLKAELQRLNMFLKRVGALLTVWCDQCKGAGQVEFSDEAPMVRCPKCTIH